MNIYKILIVTFGMLGAFTSIAQTNNTDKLDIEICGVVSRTYELGPSLGEGDISNWDNTPLKSLAKAAKEGDTVLMKQIIDTADVDLDTPDPIYGNSLLHWTVLNRLYDAPKFLLEHGSNPNFHSKLSGLSPFILACSQCGNQKDLELLKQMLYYGADPNDAPNFNPQFTGHVFLEFKLTPLTAACKGINPLFHGSDRIYYLKAIQLLLANGADINQHAVGLGITPVISALLWGNLDIVKSLLLMGADTQNCYIMQDDKKVGLIELVEKIENNKYSECSEYIEDQEYQEIRWLIR